MGANTSLIRNKRTERVKKQTDQQPNNNKAELVGEEAVTDAKSLLPAGYQLQKTIGEGSYGKVKLAFSRNFGHQVAIKIVNPSDAKNDYKACFLKREKHVTYVVRHPNIVRCFDILECGPKMYMILEYIDNGDLFRYTKKKKFVNLEIAKGIFQGIVSAITYLHKNGVAHRDLKLENILLTKELVPKITDFGFAKKVMCKDHKSKTFCGSQVYSSLEILAGIPYDIFKADIWSLGVILYTIVTGGFPFHQNKLQLLAMRKEVSFRGAPQEIPHELSSLIRRMLEPNPLKRLSIVEVSGDEWVGMTIQPASSSHRAVAGKNKTVNKPIKAWRY
eukprot:gene18058-19867_t